MKNSAIILIMTYFTLVVGILICGMLASAFGAPEVSAYFGYVILASFGMLLVILLGVGWATVIRKM